MNLSYQQKQFLELNLLALTVTTAVASMSLHAETIEDDVLATEALVVVGQATSGLDNVISSSQLENFQVNDLTDVFRTDPSITAGGSVGMGQKIYMRNLGEDSLMISVDGAEQASSTFHHAGRISIDPELLKQVEIEAGAGSAAAGPGALGGSIRFVTKDPDDLLSRNQNAGALLKSTYHSNGDGWKNTATVYGRNDKGTLSGMLSLSDLGYDNLDDGAGNELLGTESDKQLGYAKIVAHITPEQDITISHENLEEEGDVLYRPEWIPSGGNPIGYTTSERTTTIVNYAYQPIGSELVDLTFNLYRTENEQTRHHPVWGGTYGGVIKTSGFTLQNKSLLGAHELTYGVNYRNDESTGKEIPDNPVEFAQENGDVRGVYIQDVVSITERLTVSTGLRFDDYELTDADGLNFSDHGFSPNLSANYELTQGVSVSAGYAEAFRGPEVRDAMKLTTYDNDVNLQGERAKNLELGLNFDGGDYHVAVGIYRAVIEGSINAEGSVPWSGTYTNLEEDIETLGYFVSVQKEWDKYTFAASLNIADTEVGDEKSSRYVYGSSATSIGDTLTLNLDYHPREDLQMGWSAEFVRGIDQFSLDVGGDDLVVEKPGYSVHDVYARWLPTGDEDFSLTFSINNLFDKQYLSHASIEDFTNNAGYEAIVGSAESGRDIRLTAALRF
jgi:hemoglobin/transferrin/lactoferrin receptor protein